MNGIPYHGVPISYAFCSESVEYWIDMVVFNNCHGCQELITRSLQLPHIPVTAFSQTNLFLV